MNWLKRYKHLLWEIPFWILIAPPLWIAEKVFDFFLDPWKGCYK